MSTEKNKSIALLQPEVPHYRSEFFNQLKANFSASDLYIYNSIESANMAGFNVDADSLTYVKNFSLKGLLFYSFAPLLQKKYDTLVLMLHFAHITTWLLLLTKWIHRKKIILWGQGISVKRYLQEEKKPDWKLRLMISLSDGVWLYMPKELEMWKKVFPNKPMVALSNTLTGVDDMIAYRPQESKEQIKKRLGITQEIVFIFCARFENNYRRTDLLLQAIQSLDSSRYGFIIIGAGRNKPDFSPFKNVYDYGAVYDTNVKRELFFAADLYFQPGWVGLSIVEAMAYGKPILTFERTEETKQCVEYSYIEDGRNGLIFKDMEDCLARIKSLNQQSVEEHSRNARNLAMSLTPQAMAKNALSIMENI